MKELFILSSSLVKDNQIMLMDEWLGENIAICESSSHMHRMLHRKTDTAF